MKKRWIKILFFLVTLLAEHNAIAAPDTVGVRVTDVTTSSLSVVWMTDVSANPTVEVYSDISMTNRLTDSIKITAMPGMSGEDADAAKQKGVMKVMVTGLKPETQYYVRAVMPDPNNPANTGYSSLQDVVTAAIIVPYTTSDDGTLKVFSNDLMTFPVYIMPGTAEDKPGLGDLIILETPNSPYPVSAFIGEGIKTPEGILDMNNIFGADKTSLLISGGEKAILKIYRGGALSTLTHYRWVPQSSSSASVSGAVKGFFADVNLDGNIDLDDFNEFKKHYRTVSADTDFNPDFDFIADDREKVDAKDFSRFAREFGRTGVK